MNDIDEALRCHCHLYGDLKSVSTGFSSHKRSGIRESCRKVDRHNVYTIAATGHKVNAGLLPTCLTCLALYTSLQYLAANY